MSINLFVYFNLNPEKNEKQTTHCFEAGLNDRSLKVNHIFF